MLSLKIPQILVDRDRHLHSQPSSEGAYTKEPWNNPSKEGMNVALFNSRNVSRLVQNNLILLW